jgi:periplasmic protein TonB
MKTKFILPAALALTLHAFLLFGMSGKTPVAPAPSEPVRGKEDWLHLNPDDPVREVTASDDPLPEPGGPVAPRPEEIPDPPPSGDHWTIPSLPPIPGDPNITKIPPHWEGPRGTSVTSGPAVFEGMHLDHVPRARLQPAPEYPSSMRSRRVEGTVVVEFLVDEAGGVYRTAVLHATNPGFEEAALRAVARWKFESGYKNGRRVRFRMNVPVVFRIDAD